MKKGYKLCPFCDKEIKEGAKKYQYCKEGINSKTTKKNSKKSLDIRTEENNNKNFRIDIKHQLIPVIIVLISLMLFSYLTCTGFTHKISTITSSTYLYNKYYLYRLILTWLGGYFLFVLLKYTFSKLCPKGKFWRFLCIIASTVIFGLITYFICKLIFKYPLWDGFIQFISPIEIFVNIT